MLAAALAYAAAGLPVFPCGLDKRPLIAGWPSAASTDEAQHPRMVEPVARRDDRPPDWRLLRALRRRH